MADARVPPSGPPPRDPTAPARLLDAAADVALRVERAQRNMDGLTSAVDRLAEAAGVPPREPRHAAGAHGSSAGAWTQADPARRSPGRESPARSAREVAIDLAVSGVPRDAIADHLRTRLGVADADAVLAGIGESGEPRGSGDEAGAGDAEESEESELPGLPDDGNPGGSGEPPRPPVDGPGAPARPPGNPAGGSGDPPRPPDEQAEAPGGSDEPPRGMLGWAIQSYGAQVGVAALSLVNAIVMARALGAAGRGEVAFLTAIAFLTSNLWTLGVQEANVNLAGAEPETRRALATNSLILSAILGAIGGLLVAALILIVPAAGAGVGWPLLILVIASLPMLVLNTYLRFLIQGDYGFGVTNLAWFLPAVINVSINGSLAILGILSVWAAVSVWIGGQTIATLIMVVYVVRKAQGFGRPDAALARRTLKFGVKSHVGRVMLLANYRLDQWILGALAGTAPLGVYTVAVAWAEALFMLPTALSQVQRPAIVRASRRQAVVLTARVFRASLIITGFLGLGLIAAAPILCTQLFGEDFSDSVLDLRVLAFGAFGVVALKQLGNSLTGRDHPLAASLSIGVAFVCTVVLDVILIPAHEDTGAAIASSVAYTIGGAVICVVFARQLGGRVRDLVPRASDIRDLRDTGRTIVARLRRRGAEPPPDALEAPT
jgi:O-antigen/teichoic acid export membrane protein